MNFSRVCGGLLLVGDGLAGFICPRRYLRFLEVGPDPLRNTLEAFAERPALTRVACIAEVGLGVWLIRKSV
jgi:hypothetical protein